MTLRLRLDRLEADQLDALCATAGHRVGLGAVLGSLDQQARLVRVPGSAVEWGWTWEAGDVEDTRWWPQGITSTGDAGPASPYADREVLLTSWYAKSADGAGQGSRISVVDLESLRYRHVLLVAPNDDGSWFRPLHVHAGGLAWSGEHLLVAATLRGLITAHVDDVVRVEQPERFFGYRYVLPVRGLLRADQDQGTEPLRYSFCSVERPADGPARLHVGEYGRGVSSRRLARFVLDPESGLPDLGSDGACSTAPLADGPEGMQGVAVVDGVHHLTTSHGTRRAGSLLVGDLEHGRRLRRHRGALPVGPEDLAYWPEQRLLWSLSEHPGRRWVWSMRPPR